MFLSDPHLFSLVYPVLGQLLSLLLNFKLLQAEGILTLVHSFLMSLSSSHRHKHPGLQEQNAPGSVLDKPGVLQGPSLISGAGVGPYQRLLVPELGVHRAAAAAT